MDGLGDQKPLVASVWGKISEGIDRTEHLVSLVPSERLHWHPREGSWTVQELLEHLVLCVDGFCAVLAALSPQLCEGFDWLRETPLRASSVAGVLGAFRVRRDLLEAAFGTVSDGDLARRIPSRFSRTGETCLTLFLNNLEHLTNHKQQLFLYLRQLGIQVRSEDLYRFQ